MHRSGPCSGATQRLDWVPLASFGGHNFQMAVGAMGEHMGKGVRGGPWAMGSHKPAAGGGIARARGEPWARGGAHMGHG